VAEQAVYVREAEKLIRHISGLVIENMQSISDGRPQRLGDREGRFEWMCRSGPQISGGCGLISFTSVATIFRGFVCE